VRPANAEKRAAGSPPLQSGVSETRVSSLKASRCAPNSTTCAPPLPPGRQVPFAASVFQPVPCWSVIRPAPALPAFGTCARTMSRA
jgi:hypothetical protein